MLTRQRLRRLVAVGACAVVTAVGGLTSTASTASAASAGTFAARAIAAGVTASHVRQVQDQVDAFIARDGGTQVALNKVDFTGGNIVFAVPGTGRNLTAGGAVAPLDASCPYLYFCGWEGDNFTGSKFELTVCGVYTPIGWDTNTGSWMNDQSPGTRAGFYGQSHNLLSYTPPAYSQSTTGRWVPVFYVRAC